MLALGPLQLSSPFLLAPMMGLTGKTFRALVRHYGGCGLLYSEMLNSRRIQHENLKEPIYNGFGLEPDLMLQLVGDDPAQLAQAVCKLESFSPAGFDLNMGCTRTKIMKYGWGAGLLHSITKAAAAVAAMRQATTRALTVKIRTIWSSSTEGLAFLRMLEEQGVDGVIIHPRGVGRQRYGGRPDWEWIRLAKAHLKIPVFGNGDITGLEDTQTMISQTGCDGVMIGRAAVSRPYLFRELTAGHLAQPQPEVRPTPREILEQWLAFAGADLSEAKIAEEFKNFCRFFAEVLPVPHWFWAPLQSVEDGEELARRARAYFSKQTGGSLAITG